MRLAFVGYKSYLFHRQIRAYEVDIGYWSLTATVAILHLNSIESAQKTILYRFIYLRIPHIYYDRLMLDVLLYVNARTAASWAI
jgi:hypothetical protein